MAEVDSLVHDVNSACANLRSAAALLRDGKPEHAPELVNILEVEHAKLGRVIADYKAKRGAQG